MRIAEIALARNPVRVLAVPALVVAAGVALVVPGIVVVGNATGLAMAALGAIVAIAGAVLAARAMSVQLFVEVDYLHLKAIGLDRRYHLAPGQLSRLATTGPHRVKLGAALPGTPRLTSHTALAAGERVEVIRFGQTPSVVLVPTEHGRVAVAAKSESELVEALMVASHTRAMRPTPRPVSTAPVSAAPAPPASVSAAAVQPATRASVAAVVMPPLPAPATTPAAPTRPLTGIERMWMEERLVQERRAALTGAREEQAAASMSAASAALSPARVSAVPLPSPVAAMAAVAVPQAAPAPAPRVAATTVVVPRIVRPRRRPRPQARRVAAPTLTPNLLLLAAPLLGALAIWIASVVIGPPAPDAGMDPLGVALLLSGPVAVLAIYMAQSRWPRLAGLSSVAAIVALLLVGRALIG